MTFSGPAQRWIVVAPFLAVVALLALIGVASVDLLSATRAFVGGESLYAKGQKDAVQHLLRYARSGEPVDWDQYRRSIAAPLGDIQARRALDLPQPDLAAARAGFLQAGLHPDDIPGLIRMYGRFRGSAVLEPALEVWSRADLLVLELDRLAALIHDERRGAAPDPGRLRDLVEAVPPLNAQLTVLEARFSHELGASSRATRQVVLAAFLGMAALLALAGAVVTARVVRRQRAADQALRESNERWERAAAAADIGLFELDVARAEVRLDARAGRLFGLALDGPGAVPTRDLRAIVHRTDLPRLIEALARAIEDGRALDMRFRVSRPEGGWRHLELNTRSQSGGGPGPVLIGLLWDVSIDVQADELRLEKEAAERSDRAKTEFLSRVSHELRTPLNAVLGFAQLLQADRHDPLSPGQAARVGHVLDSGRHLLDLINDVLDMSSIDQGAFALVDREVDLDALLRGLVQRAEPQARPLRLRLRYAGPPAATPVRGDPVRLEQVFGNLLSNAVKYNRPGGHVEVRLRLEADHWQVEVEDGGQGLSDTALEQLYQPFNRLGAETSRVAGTGLGLVITRQLVQRMGGRLDVSSRLGRGSTFSVWMPRSPALAAAPAAAARAADASAQAGR